MNSNLTSNPTNIRQAALIIICWILSGFYSSELSAQSDQNIFQDNNSLTVINKGLTELYNFKFLEAQQLIVPLRSKFKEHPALLIFDCLTIYWRYFPLSEHPQQQKSYVQLLEDAKDRTEKFLKVNSNDAERLFYILFVDVLLAREYAAEDRSTKAATTALDAYKYIKKGFALKEKFTEFYFSTGLYNYYREFLPEQNGLYKFLAWTFHFPQGTKKDGLYYLDKSTALTVFVKPEALLLTASIYLKYENDKDKALLYASSLNKSYPNNGCFRVFYVETLIQNNRFEEAEKELQVIERLADSARYYRMSALLFKGMLEEHYHKNDIEAKKYYLNVIRYNPDWDTGNYIGLAFFGLGNISKRLGDKENEQKYFKKANKLCEYGSVKKATERY